MHPFMKARASLIAWLADACRGTELRLDARVRDLPYIDAANAIDAWIEALGGTPAKDGLIAEAQRASVKSKGRAQLEAWVSAIGMMTGLYVHLMEEVHKRRVSCSGCNGHGGACSGCGGMGVVFDGARAA